MNDGTFSLEDDIRLDASKVTHNPDDDFYREFLKPYYVLTKDGQFLFASTQAGRRPDRAFYMVPEDYPLGTRQRPFDVEIGKALYDVALRYLRTARVIVQEGIQGESGYEVGLRVTTTVENPHSAYIAWMGKMMIFPPKENMHVHCFNYIIPEPLPAEYVREIQEFWPEYDPKEPITLYDFMDMKNDVRRVLSLGIDYFGGAYKKPNLTMVWNRGELDGLISYHAGCTTDRVLKGLSGTGKTTLTVGPELEQDDACFGRPVLDSSGNVDSVELVGLEAASFAKSEGLVPGSPEWPGLMRSAETDEGGKRPIILAMNIDCENVDFVRKTIADYEVLVPEVEEGKQAGSLQCTRYEKSGTTNGRFIFLFSELNPGWGSGGKKWLRSESLSYKRFDVLEPMLRVTDPAMATAMDSGCESIITSAIAAQKVGTRVRSYAATDFMVGEQSRQALVKLKMYRDLGLGPDGKLVFFINNAGFVGEYDLHGDQIRKLDENGEPVPERDDRGEVERDMAGEVKYVGQGEKVTVQDSKTLVHLAEHRKIESWIENPIYGYLLPDPRELEERHGMKDFARRFNPLRFYSPTDIVRFAERDIKERTEFLGNLFKGQNGEDELRDVMRVWEKVTIPSEDELREFYERHYGVP
ncbi:MAG: phosphoenolpyruvate carboxykinase (ATP) [Thermoplasmata archaeon]|nr:phosphoenolpyruvate carboxykinase (ATP) [Thermoplasmata archaeon]